MEKSKAGKSKMFEAFCDGVLALRLNQIEIGSFPSFSNEERMTRTWKGVEKSFGQTGDSISEAIKDALRS